jgi:hypothetical protein
VRGDVRSRRIAVVPDCVLNPADGHDRLGRLAADGWGVIGLAPPDLVPAARDAWLAAIVEEVVTFLDDGYEVVMSGPEDESTAQFARALATTGHSLAGRVALPEESVT